MRFRTVLLFVFTSLFTIQAQSSGVKLTLGGYTKEIPTISRNGVAYISARELSESLGGQVYFNPANSKLEIKFIQGVLKLTAKNEFAVYTAKTGSLPRTIQMPLSPVLVHDDLYIAIQFYEDLFSEASGREIGYNRQLKQILIDAKKTSLAKEEAKEEKKVKEGKEIKESKEVKENNEASGGKESLSKKEFSEHNKSLSETKKADTLKSKEQVVKKGNAEENIPEVKTDKETEKQDSKAEDKKLAASKFDVAGLRVESKSNGTLIRLICRKRITKYSASINNGILCLNLLGVKADQKVFNSAESKGLVKKVSARNISNNSQIEFQLKDGYSTYETFQDSPGNDLLITIHNKLLSKAEQNSKLEKWALRTIVIDPGHGGKDPGAIGVNGTKEKDVNLAIALKLGEIIQENMPEVKVIYTRSTDKFVELYKRGKIANEKNGNLFISVHCNSTPAKPTSANGFEIYLLRPGRTKEAISIAERENSVIEYEDNPSHYQKLTDENFILVSMAHSAFMRYSERFSDLLNKHLTGSIGLSSNGIKQAGFYVLVGASMPSVLVETGFISNKNDEAYLASKAGQKNIASAIYKSVQTFKEEYDKNVQMEMDSASR
ncbi:MAG: N-acetylmuramoyl-L-alanine amidase [Bacillota bacterium]